MALLTQYTFDEVECQLFEYGKESVYSVMVLLKSGVKKLSDGHPGPLCS